MTRPADPRRITDVWGRVERGLQGYTQRSCAARVLGFEDREGWYLVVALIVLTALTGLLSRTGVASGGWLRGAASLVAAYYVLDSLVVHTTIAFVTHRPVQRLRAILLTIFNVLNVAMAFAVVYASERWCFRGAPLSFVDAAYFAVQTLTTLGFGDIVPDRASACGWIVQLTVVAEVMTGVYFLAVVVTTVVSWAPRPDERSVAKP